MVAGLRRLALGLALALAAGLVAAGCGQQNPPETAGTGNPSDEEQATERQEAAERHEEQAQIATDESRFSVALLSAAYQGERDLAELASERAESDRVRAHADDLLDDYDRLLPEVEDAADELDIDLDEQEGLVAQVHSELQRVYDQQLGMLEELEGEEFDQAYLESLVATHEATLAELQRVQPRIDEEAAQGLVEDQIPAVERHLERARDVADREDIDLAR